MRRGKMELHAEQMKSEHVPVAMLLKIHAGESCISLFSFARKTTREALHQRSQPNAAN